MALRPAKDLAIHTSRDDQRVKSRAVLDEMYARMDAQMRDALGDDEEFRDDPSKPRLL